MNESPPQVPEHTHSDSEMQTVSDSLNEQAEDSEGVESLGELLDEEMSWEELVELGYTSSIRFEQLGHLEDITIAIRCYQLSIDLVDEDHPARAPLFNNLGNSYASRFERYDELADIENAISCQSQAVRLTPEDHEDRPNWLDNLGISYRRRFERLGELSDLDRAMDHHNQAMLLTSEGHTDRAALLSHLGQSYLCRFERFGELEDVDKAVEYQREAAALTADDHEEKSMVLNNLGNSYLRRFERMGTLEDINKAIDFYGQAVLLTPDDYADKPRWLINLGTSYLCRFNRLDEVADLEQAIKYHDQAVLLTPADRADKPAMLGGLGNSYQARFERFGSLPDLDKAIECQRQAVFLAPEGHADKPTWHISLGNSYLHRFERLGEVVDIDKAILHQSQAVSLTPEGHIDKPRLLNNLGTSYMRRFERFGELADVDRAIECQIQPLQRIPDDHPLKPALLSNLGVSYKCRFERLGDLKDIERAIEFQVPALSLTPEEHPDRPTWLSNLGVSYMHRFSSLGKVIDIDKAIDCHSQAVQGIPEGHASEPAWLNNLGNSYFCRFEHIGEVTDIIKAIKHLGQAVLLTPDNHPDIFTRLSNLGNCYMCRFKRTNELSDLNKAIECHNQAVLLTPEGHAGKSGRLNNLGRSYFCRFESTGERADIVTAGKFFQEAAQLIVTEPRVQLSCTREWAKLSLLLGVSPQPAYLRIMELVPQLIWLGVNIGTRYELLAEVGDVAMEASAWAISVQAYDLAVEWLEQGRSIVWNQILQLRTPFDELSDVDSALAQRLREIGGALEQAGSHAPIATSSNSIPSDLERDTQRHHQLATEWDQLLSQARGIPGFHDFMRPRRLDSLASAAKDGPIVIINIHSTRCDALIIRPNSNEVAHVPLKDFSQEKAVDIRAQIAPIVGRQGAESDTRHVKRPRRQSPKSFETVLPILWSDVVKPILDFLGYKHKLPNDHLPHVTWYTTGALSFLPLHAAGCHDGSQPTASELVVSSYTPTLSALLSPTPPMPNPRAGVLAVGQEATNGLSRLPCTRLELASVKQHAEEFRYLQLEDEDATVDAVLNSMDNYSWIHFACHATQQIDDPGKSAFHLHDGDLMLSTITKQSFKSKGLAFLSACQTATGSKALPDEAVHLAAGMLMAGYPSVIATMWAIQDEDAPEVARDVYAQLLKDGEMNCTKAARALHTAVCCLRQKVGEKAFERWVPFVHIGISRTGSS